MKFSPLPCYLVPLRPKYSPQHSISNTLSLLPSTDNNKHILSLYI
jgi:hypothetical protein